MKVKLRVPTDLSDISLSQYQKFLRTTKDSEDEFFIANQVVSIFCNISDDLVKKISKRDYDSIVTTITEMLNKEHKPPLQEIITYNGKEYGFIPNLEEITVGEQADIDSMLHDWQKMDKVMGVLYRPIKAKTKKGYLIEDYKTGVSLDLPMSVVQGALVFFYNLLNDLLICIQSYIKAEVRTQKLEILEKSGVGINQFTQSLEETFSSLITLLNYPYTRLYSFSHSKQIKTS